jgi:hypothetical protein
LQKLKTNTYFIALALLVKYHFDMKLQRKFSFALKVETHNKIVKFSSTKKINK